MLLQGGGGQVHAWTSQEAYQKLKHLLGRTKLPPEVRVQLEKAFSEMVDRLYEWHKGDLIDPGPPRVLRSRSKSNSAELEPTPYQKP